MKVVGDVRSNLASTAMLAERPTWPERADAPDHASIAGLSANAISQMSRTDMIRIIGAANLPMLPAGCESLLEYQDDRTLERLVYLARRCCSHRLTAPVLWRGEADELRSVCGESPCCAAS